MPRDVFLVFVPSLRGLLRDPGLAAEHSSGSKPYQSHLQRFYQPRASQTMEHIGFVTSQIYPQICRACIGQ